jgi:hypothetical protein
MRGYGVTIFGEVTMNDSDNLIDMIVDIEWKMFQNVQNTGGRAACQDDYETFKINRSSQMAGMPETALESYLDDLAEADKNGRNPLSEKFARMMQSTSPSEYALIEDLLPPLDPEVPPLIDKIVEIVLEWEQELSDKYPHILGRGRPLRSTADTPAATSKETYLRGELATYSARTLGLYLEYLLHQKADNVNGSGIILENMVKQYGYNSLEEANSRLGARQ